MCRRLIQDYICVCLFVCLFACRFETIQIGADNGIPTKPFLSSCSCILPFLGKFKSRVTEVSVVVVFFFLSVKPFFCGHCKT